MYQRSHTFFVVAKVCGGVVGTVFYRYALLPVAAAVPLLMQLKFWFLGLAVVCGFRVWKTNVRRGLVSFLCGLLGMMGVAFFVIRPADYVVARVFPGFMFMLPPGKLRPYGNNYRFGRIVFDGVQVNRGVVVVEWKGGLLTAEAFERAAAGVAKSLDVSGATIKRSSIDGRSSDAAMSLAMESDSGPIALSYFSCGTRYVLLTTMIGESTLDLQRRIVRTFVCSPDSTKEVGVHE
jgi:hypothetical protein